MTSPTYPPQRVVEMRDRAIAQLRAAADGLARGEPIADAARLATALANLADVLESTEIAIALGGDDPSSPAWDDTSDVTVRDRDAVLLHLIANGLDDAATAAVRDVCMGIAQAKGIARNVRGLARRIGRELDRRGRAT